MAIPYFAYPFINWYTMGHSSFFTITNDAAMNIHVEVFMWMYVLIFLAYISKSEIAGCGIIQKYGWSLPIVPGQEV